MVTGDEPSLPQAGDDNAPMISGRGTKIIADARGAYLAGNLNALIEAMDEQQRLRFREALIIQARYYVLEYQHEASALDLMLTWPPIPSQTDRDRALDVLVDRSRAERSFVDGQEILVAHTMYGTQIMLLIIALSMNDLLAGISALDELIFIKIFMQVERIGYVSPEDERWRKNYQRRVNREYRLWQLNAAWAILQGRPFPRFDEEIIVGGREDAYQARDLEHLVEFMTDDQKSQFREHVEQIVQPFRPPLPPPQPNPAVLMAAEDWKRNVKRLGVSKAQIELYDELYRILESGSSLYVFEVAKTIMSEIDRRIIDRTPEERLEEILKEFRRLPVSDEVKETWQIEAAWAILQGNDVPPFVIDE